MCPHPLLCLAVRAALAVEAGRRVTRAGQGGVKGVGRQRAVEEVLVWAQVVPLSRGGAGQAEILVVGTSSAADPGGCLLSSQLPDLNAEKKALLQSPPQAEFVYISVVFTAFHSTESRRAEIFKSRWNEILVTIRELDTFKMLFYLEYRGWHYFVFFLPINPKKRPTVNVSVCPLMLSSSLPCMRPQLQDHKMSIFQKGFF